MHADQGGVHEDPLVFHELWVQLVAAEGTDSGFGPSLTLNNELIKINVLFSLLPHPLFLHHHTPSTPASLVDHQESFFQMFFLVLFEVVGSDEPLSALFTDMWVHLVQS